MDISSDNFGFRLRSMIEARRLSIDSFADQYGIARSTAHLWLNRAAPPLEKHWTRLADFFGVSRSYISTGVPDSGYRKSGSLVAMRLGEARSETGEYGLAESTASFGAPSSRSDVERYFRRYCDIAEATQNPNAFPTIMTKLENQFPLDEWVRKDK